MNFVNDHPKINETIKSILAILAENAGQTLNSFEIKKALEDHGIQISDSTIRHHLKYLDAVGLTENLGKKGRRLTELGLTYLNTMLVENRLNYIQTKIESNASKINFDYVNNTGTVMANVGVIPIKYKEKVISILKEIPSEKLPTKWVSIIQDDRYLNTRIPENCFALCNIGCTTLDALLIRNGIFVWPRGHGTVYIRGNFPIGYKDFISFEGCTADPPSLFIYSRLTSYLEWVRRDEGLVLSVIREIPVDFLNSAMKIIQKLNDNGIVRILKIGRKNGELLGFSTTYNRVGVADVSGSNIFAAIYESGIPLQYCSIDAIIDINRFTTIDDL